MPSLISYFVPVILATLFWISARPFPVNTVKINNDFEALIETVKPVYNTGLQFRQVIDVQGNQGWEPVLPNKPIRQQNTETQLATLEHFPAKHLDTCNRFYKILFRDKLETRKKVGDLPAHLQLSQAWFSDRLREQIQNLPLAERQNVYTKNIITYLGIGETPAELIAYGEHEVREALAVLQKFESRLQKNNIATSIEDFAERHTVLTSEAEIIETAQKRLTVIKSNLPRLFYAYDIPETDVRASLNTSALFALGSYSPRNNAFVFYWDGKTFKSKDIDYLVAHELVPGHHLQIKVARKSPLCTRNGKSMNRQQASFMEGWATYIETLSPELGLFQNPVQELGWLDWKLIRSIRIVLDVRMHHDGWNDTQAQDYWNTHMPERLHHLADREIKRMRKMPMQVITYKVGAGAILHLKESEQKRLGVNFDIRKFHDRLLRMGPVPPRIIKQAYMAFEQKPS